MSMEKAKTTLLITETEHSFQALKSIHFITKIEAIHFLPVIARKELS